MTDFKYTNFPTSNLGTGFPTSNMVMNHQSIFLPIKFHLDWISDTEMRELMLNYYLTQDMAYPDEALMVIKLQNKANLIAEYWNKLYKLKTIEYKPLENYDRYEDIEDNGTTSGTSNSNSESNAYEFPMEAPLKKQTAASDGKGTANSSATAQSTRKAHIHGNIGVTTSQQMLESEINLQKQLSMLKELYIKQYDSLFFINF